MAISPKARRISKELARAIPSSKQGETPGQLQEFSTNLSTVFTRVGGTQQIYAADRWVTFKVTLQTAGPVDLGTRADITPVLSGKGRGLVTGQELTLVVGKGTRVYYTAAAVNRLLVTIEPIPWLQQIAMEIRNNASSIIKSLVSIAAKPATSTAPATASSGKTATELNCPTPRRSLLPKINRNRGRK